MTTEKMPEDKDEIKSKESIEPLGDGIVDENLDLLVSIYKMHARDPNSPMEIIEWIEQFLANEEISSNPEKYERTIEEMKIQAVIITSNSPYAEVRAVVDNHDDPTLPVSTIRAWVIGIFFSCCISFINAFFDIRLPGTWVEAAVPQLLAYPLGKLCERILPDKGFTLSGVRHSLNPGPFNKKEHMLITIMSNISDGVPYTNHIIWIQFLPEFFHQEWASNGLSTNLIGYGMAGLCRRFLVYPSYCVWPSSLVTIAMNSAFHDTSAETSRVLGPFKSTWKMSRLRLFAWAFGLMFVYFWFPDYIFGGMTFFSWMSWISPENGHLARITGSYSGLGLNPLPTLDWNLVTGGSERDPLVLPFFSIFNYFIGSLLSAFVILGIYYTNTFNTAYLPMNSNAPFDHFGKRYDVKAVIDERGIFDGKKYAAYSPPFLSAATAVVYMFFFAVYSATITYGFLYHRHEIMLEEANAEGEGTNDLNRLDVHNWLMAAYKEVPEWWYMVTLVVAVALGMAGIAQYPTETTPFVVLYGIALCLLFVVTLNVIAEFIGGVWVEGNAVAMCFFKCYGNVTCAHALSFTRDLKLAHYLKIPQRFTFWAQMVPTLASTFISIAVLQYQVGIPKVCTDDAPFRFKCPRINTFFTAAVFWGTVGPRKIFGMGGPYAVTLVGIPIGCMVVAIFYFLSKKWPKNAVLRNAHPVVMMRGGLTWSPRTLAYVWPGVPVAAFSWLYLKKRFLPFWSKYNYRLKTLPEGEYFGPRIGEFS
ncbi:OPT oligopeptide transporter protein-domain-containing protein [Rhypophila decipiens]|uniref:OPT oligopeptide transporter protein-domain-containing protein n=1 Tax=Rhypophila decipiens TaxID=261697 RepID=A0AAN6Y028_9PEZI|nr:OPT oligopeptide transporter protein-domain-containing protein [Rhypophila decipiens]